MTKQLPTKSTEVICHSIIRHSFVIRFSSFVIALLLTLTNASTAQVNESQLTTDVKFLASLQNRMPGTPGYRDAAQYVQQQIALNNVLFRRQLFPLMVPFTELANITIPAGRPKISTLFGPRVSASTRPHPTESPADWFTAKMPI